MTSASPARRPDGPSREVEIEGRVLTLSSLDKVLWPEASFTKGEMLDYYARVAPALLPHLAGRPVTLGRFPEGVERYGWYQTQCRGRPAWLPTRPVRGRGGTIQDYCVVNDLPALLWVANIGAIELHPFLARGDRIGEPTAVVFDLDPGPPAGLVDCCRVALWLRAALERHGLASFPKTSGSLGLHVYAPLNTPHGYGETKPFARRIARELAGRHPDRIVEKMARSLRAGNVLVDWSQNDVNKSTIAPYSLRGTAWPAVSTPLGWDEVERALGDETPGSLAFGPAEVLERLDRFGDLFGLVLDTEQTLPA